MIIIYYGKTRRKKFMLINKKLSKIENSRFSNLESTKNKLLFINNRTKIKTHFFIDVRIQSTDYQRLFTVSLFKFGTLGTSRPITKPQTKMQYEKVHVLLADYV